MSEPLRCTCSQQFGSGGHSSYCALLNGGTDLRERYSSSGAAANAAEGGVQHKALSWALTQAISALENWGRHHEWCAVARSEWQGEPGTEPCICGYREQMEQLRLKRGVWTNGH